LAKEKAEKLAEAAKKKAEELAKKVADKALAALNQAKSWLTNQVHKLKNKLIVKFFTGLLESVPDNVSWARDALKMIGLGGDVRSFEDGGKCVPASPVTRAKVAMCNIFRTKEATRDIKLAMLGALYDSLRSGPVFALQGDVPEVFSAVTNPRTFTAVTVPSPDCPTTYQDETLHNGMVQVGTKSLKVKGVCEEADPGGDSFAWCLGDPNQPTFNASSWEMLNDAHNKIGRPQPSMLRPCKTMKSFKEDYKLYRSKFSSVVVTDGVSLNARNTPHMKVVIDRWLVMDAEYSELKKKKLLCRGEVYMFQGFCTGCCCAKGLMTQSSHSAITFDNMVDDAPLRDKIQSCPDWFAFLEIAISGTNGIIRALYMTRKQFGNVCRPYNFTQV